jgi:RimJ/RimL family protein N-acetyltransferase
MGRVITRPRGDYARVMADEISLRDGSTAVVRPIEPDDSPRLREIWDGMSELSRRRRFLAPTGEVSDEDMRYLVEVDHRRHDALLALDEDGRGIAVARYVREPGDRTTAELAVVVADDWHRRGLATALVERLSARARENGIEHYSAIVSRDNAVVLDALERVGAERTGGENGEIEFAVDVPAEGVGDSLAATLRAAGESQREFLAAGLRRLAVWRRRG